MNWLLNIETELQRIQPNENPGRTRTIARRIAGIALQHFYRKQNEDYLKLLTTALNDSLLPEKTRSAIERLTTRLDANFQSPSLDPINDAMIVVEFVKTHPSVDN